MKRMILLSICLLSCLLSTGCGSTYTLKDGYYKAETSEYDHGWKEFVSVCIMEGRIVSVEYNAKNTAGFIKSWDIAYMRNMNPIAGTYPNYYTRNYGSQLMEKQSAGQIDAISGASSSAGKFKQLADAVLKQAEKGDTKIAVVEVGE